MSDSEMGIGVIMREKEDFLEELEKFEARGKLRELLLRCHMTDIFEPSEQELEPIKKELTEAILFINNNFNGEHLSMAEQELLTALTKQQSKFLKQNTVPQKNNGSPTERHDPVSATNRYRIHPSQQSQRQIQEHSPNSIAPKP